MTKYDRSIEDIERARMEEGRFWPQQAGPSPYGIGSVSYGEPLLGTQPRPFHPLYNPQFASAYNQPYLSGMVPGGFPFQPAGYVPALQPVPLSHQAVNPSIAPVGQNVYWTSTPQIPMSQYAVPQQFVHPLMMQQGIPLQSPAIGTPEAQLQGGWEAIAQHSPYFRQTSRAFGRPPRGYKRPDELIRDEICKRLTLTPEIDATEVEVMVKDGEVTLRGIVDDRFAKRLVEDITETSFGVRDVLNELRLGSRLSEQEFSTATKGKEK